MPTFEAWTWSPRDDRKIRRSFPTQSAAKSWRRDAASDVARGKLRAPTSATLNDESRGWIERAERGEVRARGGRPYKPSVLRRYRADLERYILPALGSVKVSQLRRRMVQEGLVDDLVTRGLSGSRVRGVLNGLRAVLRRPLQAEELQVDPTRPGSIFQPTRGLVIGRRRQRRQRRSSQHCRTKTGLYGRRPSTRGFAAASSARSAGRTSTKP